MKAFAERLREIQRKENLTQAQLANKLGIAPGTLSGYLSDKNNPQIHDVAHFAEVLDVTIGWLCGENAPKLTNSDTYMDLFETIDNLLTLSSEDTGLNMYMFKVEIEDHGRYDPESDVDYRTQTCIITTEDSKVVDYYKKASAVLKLLQDGTIDKETYGQILKGLRNHYSLQHLDGIDLPFL